MKTLDWPSILDAKVLLVGENSTLQWKDEVIEHAMFLNYYFNKRPYDLGERSRHSEATIIFDYLREITAGFCKPEQVYATLLSNDILSRPPKGKRILIPAKDAETGLMHIKSILKVNPNIQYIFVMGMQANYYLQKLGLYDCGDFTEEFIKGAEPRRDGASNHAPYYQPVNPKAFRKVCFNMYDVKGYKGIKIIPILPVKSYPLNEPDYNHFGVNFENIKSTFNK